MRPREHVILGSVAGGGLYYLWGPQALYFWVASFMIDIDHYMDYIYNNKFTDFSFARMLDYHVILFGSAKDPAFLNLSIFHSVEFMGGLYALSYLTGSTALFYIWWGFLFHIICDTISLFACGRGFARSYSIVEYLIRVRRLRARGFDTKGIYTRAARCAMESYVNQKSTDSKAGL